MQDDDERTFDGIIGGIKQRVRKQVRGHLAIDPRANPRGIIELQIRGEKQRFRAVCEKLEHHDLAGILDECLDQVSKELRAERGMR